MKRVLFVVLALLLSANLLMAQDAPKAEVFGGYSLLRTDTGGLTGGSENLNGWNAALTGNFTKNFGITADFSGHYKSLSVSQLGVSASANFHSYTFLFGPQVGGSIGKARPFVHALFGANRASVTGSAAGVSASISDTGWAMAFGGGLDVKASKILAIRVAQADYLRTNHGFSSSSLGVSTPSVGLNNFRFSAGIVLNLGGK